jgi:hypothetical protein
MDFSEQTAAGSNSKRAMESGFVGGSTRGALVQVEVMVMSARNSVKAQHINVSRGLPDDM